LLKPDELKNWLHRDFGRADKPLFILSSFDTPCDVAQIKARGQEAGFRAAEKWNVSSIVLLASCSRTPPMLPRFKLCRLCRWKWLERVKGIEPSYAAWEAAALDWEPAAKRILGGGSHVSRGGKIEGPPGIRTSSKGGREGPLILSEAQNVVPIKGKREYSFAQNVATDQNIKSKAMTRKFTALHKVQIELPGDRSRWRLLRSKNKPRRCTGPRCSAP
jgi:hypothetical protein